MFIYLQSYDSYSNNSETQPVYNHIFDPFVMYFQIIAFEKELLSQLDNVDPSVITEYFATSLARQVSEFQQTLTYITKVIQSHVTDDMVKEHQNMGGIDDLEDNIPGWILAIACAAEPRVRKRNMN